MSRRVNALVLVMIMAISPLVPMASAHPTIGLSTDVSHIILSPGEATNLTLTINNNGSAIESYSITVSGFDSAWEIIPTQANITNVIPTLSATTTIAVRLSTSALPINSGTLTITVTEPDADVSSEIDVQLSVLPQYLPNIDASGAGDSGLVNISPGDSLDLSILVKNNGNVNDTVLVSAGQSPDLATFWANWTSGGGNGTSGNSTGDNGTSGNSTGGNGTSGNSTGGNGTSGNSTGGNGTDGTFGRSSHSGWEVRFLADVFDVMNPGESRVATLRISTPTDVRPGFYGFDLFAASALGNFSVNTTIVVNVTAIHDLSFSHIHLEELLPGENSTTQIEITSLSNTDGNWTWNVLINSGDCTAELSDLETQIMEDDVYNLEVLITAGTNTYVNDECEFTLEGVLDENTEIVEEYIFNVYVSQSWALSMVLPTAIKLDVETLETFNVAISNDGTEEDTISLTGVDSEGITFTNPAPVTLARGDSQYVVMGVTVDSSVVGDIILNFTLSSTNSGIGSVNLSESFEVREFSELSIIGPADSRIIVTPGENSSIILNVSNDGTKDLELSASIVGLPNGITVARGLEDISLEAGESIDVILEILASSSVQPISDSFTITFDGVSDSESMIIELQVTDRNEVIIDSSEDRIIASPVSDSNLTLMVTNLGTATQTFVAEINNSALSDFFTISVERLTLTLDAGQSGTIDLSAREIATGAPNNGIDLVITISSTTDSTVQDSITINVVPTVADGLITVMSDDDDGKPGDSIFGSVIITNLGTSTDTMRINSVELNCNLDDAEVVLSPSMSSSPIPWSCIIPEDENAGNKVLTFRLTSASRSDMMVTFSEAYTVEPTWDKEVISFTFDQDELSFDKSNDQQTISLTVCNEANTYVEGSLDLTGKNEPQMDAVFFRAGETGINSTYALSSKGCQDFRLMLTPLNLDGFEATLIVHSNSQVLGETVRDQSEELSINVEGPVLSPDGLDLGILELNNKNSIILVSSGWALAALLILYIKLFRKPMQIEEEEEEEEEIPLGPNEVRIDEYNKVTCTNCEARLGVPEGSEPPFRFTCPKCETKIRVVE